MAASPVLETSSAEKRSHSCANSTFFTGIAPLGYAVPLCTKPQQTTLLYVRRDFIDRRASPQDISQACILTIVINSRTICWKPGSTCLCLYTCGKIKIVCMVPGTRAVLLWGRVQYRPANNKVPQKNIMLNFRSTLRKLGEKKQLRGALCTKYYQVPTRYQSTSSLGCLKMAPQEESQACSDYAGFSC